MSRVRSVRFVTASKCGESEFKDRPIYKLLRSKFDLYAKLNNTEGLSRVYNLFLDGELSHFQHFGPHPALVSEDDLVVFVHDDVEVFGNNVSEELNHWASEGFSVMGLAGGFHLNVKSPALWHLMTPEDCRSGTSIFHNVHRVGPNQLRRIPEFPKATTFGPLREVEVLDGLFLAVTLDNVRKENVRFDEDFTFHHYDIAFCIRATRAGLKLRTVFIPVLHSSPGLSELDTTFRSSEETFLRKYKTSKGWPTQI